eukprot:symbB.v1.2.025049.t1/scaffold2411.1/size79909/3
MALSHGWPPLQRLCVGARAFSSARIRGYTHYYGKLKNQEGMLRDTARNEPYRAALEEALQQRPGSPEIARVASRLSRSNGFGRQVEVIPKHLEDVTEEDVPLQSVDIIVSELFAHFLVGEVVKVKVMLAPAWVGLQVVTEAKKFLKPGGLVLPSSATLKLAPFEDSELGAEHLGPM